MAKQVIVRRSDDIDGTVDDTVDNVNFSLDGVDYEIDLSEKNQAELREALTLFIDSARRAGGRRNTGTGVKVNSEANRERLQNIRKWAEENGHEVSSRGRIKSELIEAFDKAHA